jgi:hypothetical protein
LDHSDEPSRDPLDALERALRHLMAAGRKYAAEIVQSLQSRAKRWLLWIVLAAAVGMLALIGLLFLFIGAAQFVQEWMGLFPGGGYLLVGLALVAVFAFFIALLGGGKKK